MRDSSALSFKVRHFAHFKQTNVLPAIGIPDELCEILTSLADTFITESNFSSFEDLFMFIEEAYWYYIDIHLIQNTRLPKPDLSKFAELTLLATSTYPEMMKKFESFKRLIPRYGSIILNKDMTKVVLVKEQWWGWGFPKGKGKEGETETQSAAREVYEEIGFDVSPFIKKEDFIQKESHGRKEKGMPALQFEGHNTQNVGDVDFGSDDKRKPEQEDERDLVMLNEVEDILLSEYIGTLKEFVVNLQSDVGSGASTVAPPKLNANLRKMEC
eukprot:gene6908-8030_t